MTTAPTISAARSQGAGRSLAPVFVLGCGRSGTTLLYHMLLSAGNFAVYRVESNVINLLEPRFGDLSVSAHRRRLLESLGLERVARDVTPTLQEYLNNLNAKET